MSNVPGGSALSGYREEMAGRRRSLWVVTALVAGAALVAWAGVRLGGRFGWAGLAVGAVLLMTAVVVRPRPDPARWLRGAAGEQATARLLESLPPRRWSVWHDLPVPVPGSRANIDHLVVGPTGVWMVDTKTSRAPVRAGWRRVWFGSHRLDTGPARWEAAVAEERLGVPVRPIVAVHGPGLRRRGGRAGGVKVVPAPRLTWWLRRGGGRGGGWGRGGGRGGGGDGGRGRRRLSRDEVVAISDRVADVFGVPTGAEGR